MLKTVWSHVNDCRNYIKLYILYSLDIKYMTISQHPSEKMITRLPFCFLRGISRIVYDTDRNIDTCMHGEIMMMSSNGNISALLAFCAGNSPVNGDFPKQRPVTRSFDVFFDLCLYQQLNKQLKRRWLETISRSLWRHCNVSKYSTRVTCHYHESRWQSHKIIRKFQASGLCFQCSGWQCKSQAIKATNPIYTAAFSPGNALVLRKCSTPSYIKNIGVDKKVHP